MTLRNRFWIAIACATWLSSSACRSGPDAGLPRAYRDLAVPEATLASGEARARGRAMFDAHCALCHGTRGDGHGLQREGLEPKPRDLTSAVWRRSASPRRVFFTIREGVHGTAMPAWPALSDAQAWDLTAYVLSLGERTGD